MTRNTGRLTTYLIVGAVALFGKGKETLRRMQNLPKGEMLVLGGNAPNATGWLVVLKRIE